MYVHKCYSPFLNDPVSLLNPASSPSIYSTSQRWKIFKKTKGTSSFHCVSGHNETSVLREVCCHGALSSLLMEEVLKGGSLRIAINIEAKHCIRGNDQACMLDQLDVLRCDSRRLRLSYL